jgi:hypothetical protein
MSDDKTAPQPNPTPSLPMPRILTGIIAVYMLAAFTAITYLLLKIWPQDVSQTASVPLLGLRLTFTPDRTLMVLAALSGALGAYVHLFASFADYAGNDSLKLSWAWWYVLRPFVGVALAEIVYLVFRGGLLTGAAATGINPYGIAAIAALTGLFSREATDKLHEVFETIFRTQQKVERRDPLPATGKGSEAPAVKTQAAAGGN